MAQLLRGKLKDIYTRATGKEGGRSRARASAKDMIRRHMTGQFSDVKEVKIRFRKGKEWDRFYVTVVANDGSTMSFQLGIDTSLDTELKVSFGSNGADDSDEEIGARPRVLSAM